MTSPLFDKVALIGLGLIGSSLGHAMKRHGGLAGEVVGTARSAETRDVVAKLGFCDQVVDSAAEAVRDADLVILCAPVGVLGDLAEEIDGHLKPGAIVSDVGSVKAAVAAALAANLTADVHIIPGHPIAGTEKSGPDAGFASLFDGRWTILTPAADADGAAVAKLTQFWEGCGSKVELMDAAHHDRVLAITSHVPHLIAYNIVGTAADFEDVSQAEVIKYSAGGFRDFTRIAASDPTMWRDVFLTNKDAVLDMLGRFSEDLAALQRAIRWGDGDQLFDLFTRTRKIRREIIDAGQETDAPDFGRSTADTDKD